MVHNKNLALYFQVYISKEFYVNISDQGLQINKNT